MAADAHRDRPRLCVPDAIRERFLNGPIDARSMAIGYRLEVPFDDQLDVHSRPLHEIADVPLEGRLEAEVVEHAWTKTEREIAYRPAHLIHECPAFGDGRAQRCVTHGSHSFDAAQLHPQRRQNLCDMVVQL